MGKFITLEGIEGVGKSTAMEVISNTLAEADIAHICTREPGGTDIAEAIRDVILQDYEETMSADTELLLIFAARAQHIAQVIRPALNRQQWVLSDRFTDASFAYQGGGRGIELDRIARLSEWVMGDLTPDLTFVLDAPVETAMQRLQQADKLDRIENEASEFFARVREVYLHLARACPERYRVIDAAQPIATVHEQIRSALHDWMAS